MCSGMTGYGSAVFGLSPEAGAPMQSMGRGESFSIEVKSLNGRYLEINTRLPDRFSKLDMGLRDLIKKRFSRGVFTVSVGSGAASSECFALNHELVKAYIDAENEIKEKFGVSGHVEVGMILGLRDIFSKSSCAGGSANDAPLLLKAVEKALSELAAMRKKEGETLRADIEKRLVSMESRVSEIEKRAPEIVDRFRERLKNSLKELLAGKVMDEQRLLMEAGILAERTNVNEEIVRLRSHMEEAERYLSLSEPIGRRLDFLCQELLREVNTIGSKISDAPLTMIVVELKGELEKIREQVQNIE
ncbi:MAG: YicC/YloC family endoribonuclease [Thermodesulfobacteriota bacterium]